MKNVLNNAGGSTHYSTQSVYTLEYSFNFLIQQNYQKQANYFMYWYLEKNSCASAGGENWQC